MPVAQSCHASRLQQTATHGSRINRKQLRHAPNGSCRNMLLGVFKGWNYYEKVVQQPNVAKKPFLTSITKKINKTKKKMMLFSQPIGRNLCPHMHIGLSIPRLAVSVMFEHNFCHCQPTQIQVDISLMEG